MSTYPLTFPVGESSPLGVLTRPTPTLWVLELRNGVDNRVTETLIRHVLNPALDVVEKAWRDTKGTSAKTGAVEWAPGALIITGKLEQNKFFSNGARLKNKYD